MELACLDLEGVLIPEIWIAFAELTGIEELKATTRDIPDYDVLMKQRLRLLEAGFNQDSRTDQQMKRLNSKLHLLHQMRQMDR